MQKSILLVGKPPIVPFLREQQFVSPGAYEFIVPKGVKQIKALVIGAGALGTSTPDRVFTEGGKGGGVISGVIPVRGGDSFTVTVGTVANTEQASALVRAGTTLMLGSGGGRSKRGWTQYNSLVKLLSNYNAVDLPTAQGKGAVNFLQMADNDWAFYSQYYPGNPNPPRATSPGYGSTGSGGGVGDVGVATSGRSGGKGGGFGGGGGGGGSIYPGGSGGTGSLQNGGGGGDSSGADTSYWPPSGFAGGWKGGPAENGAGSGGRAGRSGYSGGGGGGGGGGTGYGAAGGGGGLTGTYGKNCKGGNGGSGGSGGTFGGYGGAGGGCGYAGIGGNGGVGGYGGNGGYSSNYRSNSGSGGRGAVVIWY